MKYRQYFMKYILRCIIFYIYISKYFKCRIRQSMTGLDDAGMDLQAAQLSQSDKGVHSKIVLSWLDWQLPFFVTLFVITGTILFTFLVSTLLISLCSTKNKYIYKRSIFFLSLKNFKESYLHYWRESVYIIQ